MPDMPVSLSLRHSDFNESIKLTLKTDGKGQLTGTVNEDKIEEDKKRALENVKELGHKKPPASDTSKDRDTTPKQP